MRMCQGIVSNDLLISNAPSSLREMGCGWLKPYSICSLSSLYCDIVFGFEALLCFDSVIHHFFHRLWILSTVVMNSSSRGSWVVWKVLGLVLCWQVSRC